VVGFLNTLFIEHTEFGNCLTNVYGLYCSDVVVREA